MELENNNYTKQALGRPSNSAEQLDYARIVRKVVYHKMDLEVSMMFKMSKPIIAMAKDNAFATPGKQFLARMGTKLEKVDSLSVSTVDTETGPQGMQSTQEVKSRDRDTLKSLKTHRKQLKIVSDARNEKKLKWLKKVFGQFLEISVTSGALRGASYRKIGEIFQKNILGLEANMAEFGFHHNESVALALVLVCVSQAGVSLKLVVDQMGKIFRNRKIKISGIKKTKSYKKMVQVCANAPPRC